MAPSVRLAARNFDGAAEKAYQEVNRGIGTHYFGLPVATGPQKEPGGIKFSGARAQELAATLDVTSIAFDPVRGKIVLVGAKQQAAQTFDLDVFADVLRLAVEEYEPFFSLDPSEPHDWDESLTPIGKALRAKYDADELAKRVRALSPTGIPHGSRVYYYTTVETLDPQLVAQANRGRDMTVKLVYSPDWLRYSKVGAILFDGDLAIKAVASGFVERGGAIEPAFVWAMPDFDPVWLHRDDASAGRANFELAHARVREGGARLDLVDVHPGLYVTGRRPGTNEDTAPSSHDKAISEHFDKHWREYVANVPEIGRLEMVFRAYVAARFLVDHHPGLAAPWHMRLIAGVSLLVLLTAGVVLMLRQFDWQRLGSLPTCRHCVRIHRRVGWIVLLPSAITVAAMLYLTLLPLVGAYESRWSLPQIVAAAVILMAVTVSFIMLGSLARLLAAARIE